MNKASYDTNCLSLGDALEQGSKMRFLTYPILVSSSLYFSSLAFAADASIPPQKVVRAQKDLETNFRYLKEATRLAKIPSKRELGLKALEESSLGIAGVFYSADFYDNRDTPPENREYLFMVARFFEGLCEKNRDSLSIDSVDALINGFQAFEASRVDDESRNPKDRRFKPVERRFFPALVTGVAGTVGGDIMWRLLRRSGQRLSAMRHYVRNQETSLWEGWKKAGRFVSLKRRREASLRQQERAKICTTVLKRIKFELGPVLRFAGKRALASAGLAAGSYLFYFEDFEVYDASDDIVNDEVIKFLVRFRASLA